jgi:hypothetical protein
LREDGATFLRDTEAEAYFAPWAVEGFDETTMRRLRIPEGFVASHPRFFSSICSLRGEDISLFSPFFSFREYAVLNSIVIIPFIKNTTLISFLLIVDSPVLSEMSDYVSSRFFSLVSQKITDILSTMREDQLSLLAAPDDADSQNVFDAVDRLISLSTFRNKRISLIIFDMGVFIDLVVKGRPGVDTFRLCRDAIAVLKSLVAGMGDAFMLDEKRSLIVYGTRSLKTDSLLLHRIQETLKYFFHLKEKIPETAFLIRRYPEDGSSSGSLLSGVL